MTTTRSILAFSLVVLAFFCSIGIAAASPVNTDTTQTVPVADNQGSIGPDHSLYGLRIAFENLDESFTFNESELLEKQVAHAEARLLDLKQELSKNQTESADRVLDLYRQKLNQTENTLGPYAGNGTGVAPNASGPALEHAREMIKKHQAVLEKLLIDHPGNPGLGNAYNNSLELEQKFQSRLEQREETRLRQLDTHGFGKNLTARQDSGNFPGSGGNFTFSDETGPGSHANSPGDGPVTNQTRIRTGAQASNKSAGNQQQISADTPGQNGQGNVRDGGAGTGQNGNAANPGSTRNTGSPGGQGQSADQRMRNR